MGQQSHFDRVRGLVSGQSGVPASEITLETRLFEDLGMDGDDGADLLAAFGDEFGLDIRGLAPLNYFNDESSLTGYSLTVPVAAFLSPAFRTRVEAASRGLRALSARDLVASARARRWIAPQVARSDANLTRLSWWGRLVLVGSVVFPLLLGLRQYIGAGVSAGRAVEIALWSLLLFWGLLGAKFLLALPWLKRLDAAASFEEQALSPNISAED
jgi:acyl carrier protein